MIWMWDNTSRACAAGGDDRVVFPSPRGMFGIDVVGESTQLTSIGCFMVDYPPLYDKTLASRSAHVTQPLFH
jgi:hypothetical protein